MAKSWTIIQEHPYRNNAWDERQIVQWILWEGSGQGVMSWWIKNNRVQRKPLTYIPKRKIDILHISITDSMSCLYGFINFVKIPFIFITIILNMCDYIT